jgi:hypothetical protein
VIENEGWRVLERHPTEAPGVVPGTGFTRGMDHVDHTHDVPPRVTPGLRIAPEEIVENDVEPRLFARFAPSGRFEGLTDLDESPGK